ncbi:VCBS domain-containing protein [Dongia mobilis]|uniref:VCBS domain-containing protein n=1 Tax=Dongia sp. TaxID=1977262 RepID=UPI0026EE0595
MANKKATISGTNTGLAVEENLLLTNGTLVVVDPDSGQSFMRVVSGASAKYGTWSIDANGAWNYALDNPIRRSRRWVPANQLPTPSP